jgi:hypothetical protein
MPAACAKHDHAVMKLLKPSVLRALARGQSGGRSRAPFIASPGEIARTIDEGDRRVIEGSRADLDIGLVEQLNGLQVRDHRILSVEQRLPAGRRKEGTADESSR